MATSNVPARVPERQPEHEHDARARRLWPREKKPTRFMIKLGGIVPVVKLLGMRSFFEESPDAGPPVGVVYS